MDNIKALVANDVSALRIPKINGLGISSGNNRIVSNQGGITYYHKFLPYAGVNKMLEEYNDP